VSKAPTENGLDGGGASFRLCIGRDGVLEVEDHDIARQGARFLYRAGAVAR
jgi:hypothetical protein